MRVRRALRVASRVPINWYCRSLLEVGLSIGGGHVLFSPEDGDAETRRMRFSWAVGRLMRLSYDQYRAVSVETLPSQGNRSQAARCTQIFRMAWDARAHGLATVGQPLAEPRNMSKVARATG